MKNKSYNLYKYYDNPKDKKRIRKNVFTIVFFFISYVVIEIIADYTDLQILNSFSKIYILLFMLSLVLYNVISEKKIKKEIIGKLNINLSDIKIEIKDQVLEGLSIENINEITIHQNSFKGQMSVISGTFYIKRGIDNTIHIKTKVGEFDYNFECIDYESYKFIQTMSKCWKDKINITLFENNNKIL